MVGTRVEQRHEYIIRLFPLSTKSGLISSLINAPDITSNGPPGLLRRRRDSFLIERVLGSIVALDSDRKPLVADFGLC